MHRIGPIVLAACLLGLGGSTRAAEEDTRVAWLKEHVAALQSINPDDEDFSDLEPLRRAIGDARIVQLSEQSHGDGATFHARTRLIKFLHQKCGFDVLAFESGLYDCRKAWQLLRAGKMAPREALAHGVFGIWTESEQVQPLLEYLGRRAHQARPLEVCGFDCQFSGPASSRYLPAELEAVLNQLPTDALDAPTRAAVIKGCKRLASPGTGFDKEQTAAFTTCRQVLATMKPTGALPAEELAFWRQFLESTSVLAEAQASNLEKPVRIEHSYGNLRDPQMARNLVWLAQDVYPRRKIIVWAAAFHLLRNQETIAMIVEPGKTPAERKTVFPYPQIRTMGNEAWKALGKESYSLFFTAAEGEFQTVRMPKPEKLAPLPGGSLEDLLVKAGCENVFLDLRSRGKGGAWLEERLIARFLGNVDHEADWTKICDGLVFTRKQLPSTPARAVGPTTLAPGQYQPTRDPAELAVPFERYTTKDAFGRTITFYLSRVPPGSTEPLPLAVFVQGSGCASVFYEKDGQISGGLQNLLLAAVKGRIRVLVVEKPGVRFGDRPKNAGTAEEASAEFRQEHVLGRWVEAINAAVEASLLLPGVDWSRVLAVGHSEGGIVAAHLAARNPWVTYMALLAGGGPSQLFDLVELAAQPRRADEPAGEIQARIAKVYSGWQRVQADPESADQLWLGHPYRRWSSFLKTSTQEGVLASRAAVFLAQGTADSHVPVASFDALRSELAVRGRDVTAERLEGCDHGFRKPGAPQDGIDGFQNVLGQAVDWFLTRSEARVLPVRKELQQLAGDWEIVTITIDGVEQESESGLKDLQVVQSGNRRTLKRGDVVYSESVFRIDLVEHPRRIDLTITRGSQTGQRIIGIYEAEGDTLRLCLAKSGAQRPTEFTSQLESGRTLMVLKRRPATNRP